MTVWPAKRCKLETRCLNEAAWLSTFILSARVNSQRERGSLFFCSLSFHQKFLLTNLSLRLFAFCQVLFFLFFCFRVIRNLADNALTENIYIYPLMKFELSSDDIRFCWFQSKEKHPDIKVAASARSMGHHYAVYPKRLRFSLVCPILVVIDCLNCE